MIQTSNLKFSTSLDAAFSDPSPFPTEDEFKTTFNMTSFSTNKRILGFAKLHFFVQLRFRVPITSVITVTLVIWRKIFQKNTLFLNGWPDARCTERGTRFAEYVFQHLHILISYLFFS